MKLNIEPKNKLIRGDLELEDYILFDKKYFRVTGIGYGFKERIIEVTIDLSEARLGKKIVIKKLIKKRKKK